MCHFREISHRISFLDTLVPNFLNRKRSINFPRLWFKEEQFIFYDFFLQRDIWEQQGGTERYLLSGIQYLSHSTLSKHFLGEESSFMTGKAKTACLCLLCLAFLTLN
jgi:hypothetical protein